MHIGTGIYEGKEIKDPPGCGPLSCRALTIKEEVFTIIGTRVNEATVLDLNDSNGMYGIEALSRGASCCRFVNPNEKEVELIKVNVKTIGLDPTDLVLKDGPKEFLENPTIGECAEEKYDVMFFEMKAKDDFGILTNVLEKQKPSGVTVLIYPNSNIFKMPENIKGFQVAETREFDDKKVVIILKTGL